MALYLLLTIYKIITKPTKTKSDQHYTQMKHADTKCMYKVKKIYN